jgi:hypothetical protein
LPDDVETVSLRSDSAGYQTELLQVLKSGEFSTLSGAALIAAYGPQPTRG